MSEATRTAQGDPRHSALYPGTTLEIKPQEEVGLAGHPTPRQYVRIGVVLAIVTALEVAIYYIEALRDTIVPLLIVFAFIKFSLVVSWFMHLKFDSKLFARLFVTGLVLALAVFGVVLAIFFSRGAALTVTGEDATGPQTLTIRAGEADATLENGGLLAFYPDRVSVYPGDTLVFENGSGAISIPHTVTLGTPADIPNRIPPPVVPEVGQVPAVWGQCVNEKPWDKGATDCPSGSAEFSPTEDLVSMPAFAEQGYYNSGIFDPGQNVEMTIGAEVHPGTYGSSVTSTRRR
jgi:cytochrome c oxidase subunit IV